MKSFKHFIRDKNLAPMIHTKLPRTVMIRERTEASTEQQFTETRRMRMTLEDFADAISLLNAQKSDVERTVEVRLDCPDPYSILVTFFPQEEETDSARARRSRGE